MKYLQYIIAGLALFGGGFFLGRKSVDQKTSIEFIPLPVIDIITEIPEPTIETPTKPDYPSNIIKPNPEIERLKAIIAELEAVTPIKGNAYLDSIKNILSHTQEYVIDNDSLLIDYSRIRHYRDWTLYNIDTIGKFTTNIDVQYNRIINVYDSKLYPVQKVITKAQTRRYEPYISGEYNTLGFVGVGGGLFFQNGIGLGINYVTDFNKKGIGLECKYKF